MLEMQPEVRVRSKRLFEILTPYEAQILDLEPFQPYYSKPAGYNAYTGNNNIPQQQQSYQQYQPVPPQQYGNHPSQYGAPNVKFVHNQQEGQYYQK